MQAYQDYPSGGPEVAFCVSIAHAEATAVTFEAAGIPAAVLSGSTKPELRDQLLRDLATGEIKVLATCSTLDEGTDISCLAGVIMLRPTASLSRYLQQADRRLRTSEGKTHAVIRDHAGNAIKHGLPIEDREFSLSGTRPRSAREKATDGTALSVRQCPTCYGVHEPATACPYCGHVHTPDQRVSLERARELRLLEEEEAQRLAQERARVRRDQEKGEKTLADWLRIAEERGYDKRWAHMRHKLRQQKRRAA